MVPHLPRTTADLKAKMRVAMQKSLASNQHTNHGIRGSPSFNHVHPSLEFHNFQWQHDAGLELPSRFLWHIP